MRVLLLLLFVALPFLTNAQLQENFTDGNFTANPTWTGDAALFTVNAANQLQTNGPAATDEAHLVMPSASATQTVWDFWVNLKFATSQNNLAEVYLMSDVANLEGNLNGYFVRIGNTDDEVSLYKKTGATETEIIDGLDKRLSQSTSTTINNELRIRVTRSAGNSWDLETNVLNVTGGTPTAGFVSEGTSTDATHTTSSFFGVLAKYSTTNAQKFFFDEITITDTGAPALTSVTFISATQLDVLFSEPVALATAQNLANYVVSGGGGSPTAAVRDAANPALVHLTFGSALPNGTSTLTISGMQDLYGNIAPTLSGQFTLDTVAPTLTSVSVISGTALDVIFNEPVSLVSAQNVANYSVSGGGGNPTSAIRDAANPALVHLTFATALPTGTNTLSATNISDLAANVAASLTGTFSYTPPGIPAFKDVRINEILADINPAPVGLPAKEFVEIFNRSSKTLNLANWKMYDDGTTGGTLPAYLLQPGQYVILCAKADTAALKPFGKTLGLSSWPGLNDSGDDVKLVDNTGKLIDKVTYTTALYGDPAKDDGGWTLELINPDFLCQTPANWRASVDPSGGTPGRINSVDGNYTDTGKPFLSSVEVLTPTTIKLTFSEEMDSLSLVNATYVVNQGVGVNSVLVTAGNFREVTLTINPALITGSIYTLTVSDATDCPGNVIAPLATSFGSGVAPTLNQVLLTEIMADETPVVDGQINLPGAEYLEIHNPTSTVLDLKGMKLSDGTGAPAVFPAIILLPGEYAVLCASAKVNDFGHLNVRTIGLSNFPSLNNSGETLSIRSASGALIFSVTYSDTWYKDAAKDDGGWSLEMIDTANPCTGYDNWTASNSPNGGTPGKENSVKGSRPDNIAPVLVKAQAATANEVTLFFNEKLDSLAFVSAAFTIPNGPAISQKVLSSPDFSSVTLLLATPLPRNQKFEVQVSNVRDCASNLAGLQRAEFALPVENINVAKGDVVINEILFNPRTGGVDYVELINRSAKYIDLFEWKLANYEDSKISDVETITGQHYVLGPQQLVALTTRPDVVMEQYPTHNPNAFLQMSALPSMNDDEGIILLLNPVEEVYDSLAYTDDIHFGIIKDKNGVALERIRTNGPTIASNFHSAASTVGYGTPGKENSQQQDVVTATSGLVIEPKAFSPDGDGYSDFTTFNFTTDKIGQVATITIYDARGREMKKLARNELIAHDSFFRWDGTTNENRKAPVGYYLVLVELFDLSGKSQSFKETVAVGAKF